VGLWPFTSIILGLTAVPSSPGGYLIHDVFPLGLVFWATLRGSILWTVATGIILLARSIRPTREIKLMLGAGLVVAIYGGFLLAV